MQQIENSIPNTLPLVPEMINRTFPPSRLPPVPDAASKSRKWCEVAGGKKKNAVQRRADVHLVRSQISGDGGGGGGGGGVYIKAQIDKKPREDGIMKSSSWRPHLVADAAEAAPEPGLVAAVGAGRVAARAGVLVGAAGLVEDVAGAAAADVRDGGHLVADLGAAELLVKREDRAGLGGVRVAGTAAAGVEAVVGGPWCGGHSRGGDASGSGGLGSTEEVAGTATAGVGVAVLRDSGMRLGDGVGRHLDGFCGWWLWVWFGLVGKRGGGGVVLLQELMTRTMFCR